MSTYNNLEIELLKKETSLFLKNNIENIDIENIDLEKLIQIINFNEHLYYIENKPFITDLEFDLLFKLLEKIENKYPELINKNSPTQKIGSNLKNQFKSIQHLVPMLSLQNTYNEKDLIDWDKRIKDELLNNEIIEYSIEPKYDGASISLVYENNKLIRAVTRGNGIYGENVTLNAKQIDGIPTKANFNKYGIQQAEIRGEVMMSKESFLKNNEQLNLENKPLFINPRNAASGSLRIKNSNEVKKRNLNIFIYHLSHYNLLENEINKIHFHNDCLEMFNDLGFNTVEKKYYKILPTIQEVIEYCKEFEKIRTSLNYEIDGLVIKVNNLKIQENLGMTSHHPRWAVAYKFKSYQEKSILENVEFQVGRTGIISPVAKIKPTQLAGVTVSSISIFNENNIIEKDLRIGDKILIERAGDVIPNIIKSFHEERIGNEIIIKYPTNCPNCNTKLIKLEEEANWKCPNFNCTAQIIERIIYFCSKDAMDIQFLGAAKITKFYELGWLKSIIDVYKLPYEEIKKLEGFGQKSIENLQQSIEHSKKNNLNLLILGLGIQYVGKSTAQTICNFISNLNQLKETTIEELLKLDDIGPKVANSIYQFFNDKSKLELLIELENLGLNFNVIKREKNINGTLNGKTFLFTGTLETLKRSEAEDKIKNLGGTIANSVSSKLDYLILGTDAGSKLEKAKKIGTIQIINETEFINTFINVN